MITPKEKLAARNKAKAALKAGKIEAKPCAKCGTNTRVHLHHEDYSKPLEVIPLCCHCHGVYHSEKASSRNILRPAFIHEWLAEGPYTRKPVLCNMPPKPKPSFIGQTGLLSINNTVLKFHVIIKEQRYFCEKTLVLVSPISGENAQWVNIQRLELLAA